MFGSRALIVAAVTGAALGTSAPAWGAPAVPAVPVVPPAPQTLTLDAWQTPTQASSWQRKTWHQTRQWCNKPVKRTARWRRVLDESKCGTSVASTPLEKNRLFEVKVSGLVSHWRGTWPSTCGTAIPSIDPKRGEPFNASTDAQWTFATKRKNSKRCKKIASKLPTIGTGFLVNIDKHVDPVQWRFPWTGLGKKWVTNSHTYSFFVTGTGAPIRFGFYDHWVIDNYGSFTIQIAPVEASAASTGKIRALKPLTRGKTRR